MMMICKDLRRLASTTCLAGAVLLMLALAGCGSTTTTSTTAGSAASPTTTTSGGSQTAKSATYNINLSHVTGSSGTANASGIVVLTVKPSTEELCWSISPVKSFTISTSTAMATIATIQPTPNGTPSTPGVPLGFSYRSSGCTHAPSTFLGRLQAHPQMFYLSIYNTQSGDAVRGQV